MGSEGTYVTTWDGKINGVIPKDGVCTIRVYDTSNNQFPATGTLTLSSAKSLNATPNPFGVQEGSTATITAQMGTGLHLEARIGTVRTLPLSESSPGNYTATWDGKDSTGKYVASGSYNITLWNTDTNTRYDLQTSLAVTIVDTIPPDTTITSGPAEGSYVSSNVTFNWSGSDNLEGPLTFSYIIDGNPWSAFDPSTTHTFNNLSEGTHAFSVKAKDQAGNEDLSPAIRNFTVDTSPPSPASNLRATAAQTGIKLDWSHSPSSDINSYRLYWDNGTGAINYDASFATIYYPSNSFIATTYKEGTYKFGLRALDKAGNEEKNTTVIASVIISGFNLTINLESTTYDRGQDIPIRGMVTHVDDSPIIDMPAIIDIESKGFHRYYTAYTNTAGAFSYTFQPLANEAGNYTAYARVMYEGLEKAASTTFHILGLLLQPANVTVDMSMNSTKAVNLTLQNIGDVAITGIQYTIVDNNPGDLITGAIDTSALPTSINPGSSTTIPVMITANPGTPPSTPVLFTLNLNSSEGSKETTVLTANLHEAVSTPVIAPDPLIVGVRINEPVTKVATVTNKGFASMNNSLLTVHDSTTYNWITVVNGDLGLIAPSESKEFQIFINPPSGLTMGTYVIQLDLSYNGIIKPVYITLEVTTSTVGQVAFKVHDDTGAKVSGAEVNLISKEFYVNVTPQGRQEYNNVIKGLTNSEGYILFQDVPAGDYRYLINAVKHDQKKGEITVEPGTTPKTVEVIMIMNLVNVEFSVTPTTIQDQYSVTLNVTYATDLIKPTLYADPSQINLSFFPEETYEGTITITNTSNNAPVRDILIDATVLDPIDNEVKLVFANGTQTLSLESLEPKKSIQIAFKATIPDAANAKLNNRNLGNIVASGKYTFSIEGTAYESTTSTPIPVLYWRPQDLSLPAISYVNDETDGNLNDLEYQGTSYRLTLKSNRNMSLSDYGPLKAITHINGGPDNTSIINSNQAPWTGNFNKTTPLLSKGETTTFDINGLEEAMESQLSNDRVTFLGKPHYIGFFGQWEDKANIDAYLIPVAITTVRQNEIIGSYTGTSSGWFGGTVPTLPFEHGEVRIQVDQKVSLEREAFNAKLNVKPTVPSLTNVHIKLNIKDAGGNDATALFFVVVTQNSGINSLDGGTISGPAEINWQIIPSSDAGGTQPEGLNYTISAKVDYAYDGNDYSYTTQTETVTVKPMPKLILDYYLPYVVVADKPVKIKVKVTNQGAGPAHNLVIFSAQPRILENENNIPISFILNGSSSTPNGSNYQNGVLNINFGDVPAGGVVKGYWLLTTTKDGYFVEFTSVLKHENYLGIQLDPLIQGVNTHLVPAIGGHITQTGDCTTTGLIVQVWQGSVLKGQDTANESGAYFISDLVAGDYLWAVRASSGETLSSRNITVLADQPTSQINGEADIRLIDSDKDGMSDCWEVYHFGDLVQNPGDDYDHDGLTNLDEYQRGTDPTKWDTDGDGVDDGTEVAQGKNPLDPNDQNIRPVISVYPSSYDFGQLLYPSSCGAQFFTTLVTIRNIGTGPLNLSDISVTDTAHFQLRSPLTNACSINSQVLQPNGFSCDVAVSFCASTTGDFSADLVINSDDPNTPTSKVHLTGSGPLPVYVALGDSYSAGQGAGGGYDPSSGTCYRSENAYPHKIAENYHISLLPYACSGATTGLTPEHTTDHDIININSQNSQINQPEVNDANLLSITVGGDDIGFKSILIHCISEADCKNKPMQGQTKPLGDALPVAIADLKSKLIDTYNSLSNKAQSAQIYVLGYPHLFPSQHDASCLGIGISILNSGYGNYIDSSEQEFLNNMATDLNTKIKEAAEEAAKTADVTFVPVTDENDEKDVFSGHEICTETPWINGIGSIDPLGWRAWFHPNKLGQQEGYAVALKAAITNHLTIAATKSLSSTSAEPMRSAAAKSATRTLTSTTEPLPSWGDLSIEPVETNMCSSSGVYVMGQNVRIIGTGFAPNSPVNLYYAPLPEVQWAPVATAMSDSGGTLDITLRIPSATSTEGLAFFTASGTGTNGAPRSLIEMYPLTTALETDSDGDGVPDVCDNCPTVPNPDQADSKRDGIGDTCRNIPIAQCRNVTVSADSNCQGIASVNTGSFDPNGGPITIVQTPSGPYNLGYTVVTLTVTNVSGTSSSCVGTVTVSGTDSDNDGTPDCKDACPNDPNKINPGICGCGVADTDSDNDGIANCKDNCPYVYNPDQLDSNNNGIGDACENRTICSYLGNNPKPLIPDIDIFKFSGTKGETVTIRIEATNPPEAGSGKRVTLILTDKIKGTVLVKLDRSELPNEITAKLPATGEYLITVAEQVLTTKDKRFKGNYCLTLKARPETYQTLAPYLWVE